MPTMRLPEADYGSIKVEKGVPIYPRWQPLPRIPINHTSNQSVLQRLVTGLLGIRYPRGSTDMDVGARFRRADEQNRAAYELALRRVREEEGNRFKGKPGTIPNSWEAWYKTNSGWNR